MGGKNRQQTTTTAPWAPSQPYLQQGMGAASDLVFGAPKRQKVVAAPVQQALPGRAGMPFGGTAMGESMGGSARGNYFSNLVDNQMAAPVGGGQLVIPKQGELIKGALGMAKTTFDPAAYQTASSSVLDVLNDRDVSRQFDEGYSQLRQSLDSQFARAGRYGSDAHANVIADAGADLMAGLQDANAARRLSAAGQLATLEGAGTDARNQFIDRSLALGEYGNNWDYDQGMRRLQDYMSLIQGTGGMGGTSSTPQYRNGLAGALGGAATGASLAKTLGAASLGPWAAIGGIAGLL